MTYTKQTWANGVVGGTPITAARLDYIEEGIESAHEAAAAAATAEHTHDSEDISDATSAATVSKIVKRDGSGGFSATYVAGLATADANDEAVPLGQLNTLLAGRVPTSRQVVAGTGLAGGGALSADTELAVEYGSTAGTAVEGNDARVTDDQAATVAAVRRLSTDPSDTLAACPPGHPHVISDLSDATDPGLDLLGADTVAEQRTFLGLGEGLVLWEEGGVGTKWGAARPSGFKRIVFSANGVSGTEDPELTIAILGDIWEKP